MVFELFSDDTKKMLEAACAIELIHAGSLMLDDLPSMDNADYRRGKKTNHVLYGDAVTILASAALWVEAFRIVGNTPALVAATSQYVGRDGLVLGQYMDLYAFNKKQSLKSLRQCYDLKTASLFKLAVTYGAVLGGASTREQATLEKFAASFGIAYQIRDDIIDATATKTESGKDARKDEQNNKPNYVSVLGIAGARKALQKEVGDARRALASLQGDATRLRQLVDFITL
jgi:geranylgeranyl diphosphate synthase type II